MRGLSRLLSRAATVITLIVVLLIWEAGVSYFHFPKWMLPAPADIWASFVEHLPLVQKHLVRTLTEAAGGLLIGSAVGISLAAAMVHSHVLERGLMALLVIDQSIPKLALAPLFVIWFGVGIKSKILIAVMISFFPLIVNTARGLTAIDPRLGALMHTLYASKWQVFTKVRIPNAIPYIFTALRVAVPLSVIGAVVGEFVQADAGLGFLVLIAVTEIDTPLVFVAISLMALISLTFFAFLSVFESLALSRRFGYMADRPPAR